MFLKTFARPAKPFVLLAACWALSVPSIALAQGEPSEFAGQLRPRILPAGTDINWSLEDRMQHYGVPGVGIAIIEDGAIVFEAGYGVLQAGGRAAVDADTVFSAGSVSKVATASLVLNRVDAGVLSLDEDVRDRLTGWTLAAERDVAPGMPVTLRALLSHTGGFNLHGFADFPPGAALPTTVQTLNGEAPATHAALAREAGPATGFRYSGGGFTLVQALLDDVSAGGFDATAEAHLFAPLAMTRSSFANPLPEEHGNIARAHNARGEPVALPRGYEAMPEVAASGLWTSAHDMGQLVAELIRGYRGEGDYLARETALAMMTRVSPGNHGLGPRLTGTAQDLIFHHGGSNNSYRAWIEGHLATGDGLVVLTNGSQGRALIDEIRNAVADTMDWEINRTVIAPELALPAETLAGYAGVYSVDAAFPLELRQHMVGWIFEADLEFRVTADGLAAGRAGGDRFDALIPLTPTRFAMPGLPQSVGVAELEFHRNALGETTGMTFHLEDARSHYVRQ
jgi:CubicO group peptidase (beta-lactamase class C family)